MVGQCFHDNAARAKKLFWRSNAHQTWNLEPKLENCTQRANGCVSCKRGPFFVLIVVILFRCAVVHYNSCAFEEPKDAIISIYKERVLSELLLRLSYWCSSCWCRLKLSFEWNSNQLLYCLRFFFSFYSVSQSLHVSVFNQTVVTITVRLLQWWSRHIIRWKHWEMSAIMIMWQCCWEPVDRYGLAVRSVTFINQFLQVMFSEVLNYFDNSCMLS